MTENLVDSSNEENIPAYWMEQPIYYFFASLQKTKYFITLKMKEGIFPKYIFSQ